jgi:hypothetical protein
LYKLKLTDRYIDRISAALVLHPKLVTFIANFSESFEVWADLLLRSKLDDALNERPTQDKEFFIKHIRKQMTLLVQAASKAPKATSDADEVVFKPYKPSYGAVAMVDR